MIAVIERNTVSGATRTTRPDGTQVIESARTTPLNTPETSLTIKPDGTRIERVDIQLKVTAPDGTVTESIAREHLGSQTLADGTQISVRKGGLIVKKLPDGTVINDGPTGRKFTQKPDGTEIREDGTGWSTGKSESGCQTSRLG